ncbi:hypothetical protein BH20ACI1_BH20ACI1_32440 [soil metagenome]
MKGKFFKLLTVLTAFSTILILANISYAQRRRTRTVSYSKVQVEQVLRRIEEKTDKFTKVFDEALDDSRLDGSRAEENYTDLARNLENETDELRREFNRRDSYAENTPNARSVLNAATDIDRVMKRRNYGRQAENLWLGLRADFNTLARIYRIPAVGSSSYRGVSTGKVIYVQRNTRGRIYSKQQIEDLIKKIEEGTDAFTKRFDETLDDSRLNGSRAEENYTDRTRNLENAADELRREFDHSDPRGETRENAIKVLNAATVVDRIMKSRNLGNQTEAAWLGLRADINLLAGIYQIPTIGSRNYR